MHLRHLLCVLPLIALACGDLTSTGPAQVQESDQLETSPDAVAMANSTAPDLEVGASVDDSTPETGASFTLSATVTNSGNGASTATTLRYYRSSDATITNSDTEIGTDAVGALAAAGTGAQSVDLTAPSSAGTYYYGACVDAVTGESDTSNNCSASVRVEVSVPLTATLAKLPATHDGRTAFTFELHFSVEPSRLSYKTVRDTLFEVTNGNVTGARRVTPGSNLAFIVTVQPSDASDISLSVRGTTDCAAQHAVCTADGRMLAGGTGATVAMGVPAVTMSVADAEVEEAEGATLDFTLTLSRAASRNIQVYFRTNDGTAKAGADYERLSSNFTFAPGDTTTTISVVVLADTLTEGAETVKFWLWGVRGIPASQITDGHAVGTIRDPRSRPDLEVGASVDDSSPETGGSFTLSATVSNAGNDSSTVTTLRYYRSSDGTITSSDTEVGTDTVDALAAGGTSNQSVDLTAPSTAGAYYYGACADTVTAESDTTDNCSASVKVDVVDPPPDLEVGSSSVSDAHPVTGGSFTLSATVSNVGGGPSAATTLRYYRSSDGTITSSDMEVGTDAVVALAAGGTSDQSVDLMAPSSAGTYYYGACVDAVTAESATSNNCSASVRVVVHVPLTASYAYLPPTHDGTTSLWFELRFSEAPAGLSFNTVRDELFDVTNGSVTSAWRATPGSNLAFVVTVKPSAASDLSISVRGTTDCEARHAVCTDDGRMLAAGTSATVKAATRPPIGNNPSGEKFDIELIFTSNVDSTERAVVEAVRDTLEAIVRSTELTDITMPATVECGDVTVEDVGVVDDVAILFDISHIDGTSTRDDIAGNTFAWQLDCYRTTEHDFPVFSMIKMDRDDVQTILSDEEFRDLVLHELLHALGFSRTTFDLLGLVTMGEYNVPYFTGDSAVAAFVAAGGGQTDMIPLMNHGSHWSFVLNEEMMGALRKLYQWRLSAITIQTLADIGYTVDLRFAEPFQLPWTTGHHAADKRILDMNDDVRSGPVTVLDRHGTPVRVIEPPPDAGRGWRRR